MKKNTRRFLLIVSLIILKSSLQGDDYTRIDRHALNTPASAERSVESLARYLTASAENDPEKIRALFRWITANITYDTRALYVGSPGPSGNSDILKNRTAVCDGFSGLFESLGEAAGFDVVKISGHAKGVRYQIGESFTGPPNHAWNAVRLNDRWQLLDATWGAGHIDENGQFVREFDDFFFLADPEAMKYTHFPEDSRWQLCQMPLTLSEFESLPYLKSPFFHHHLKLMNQEGTLPCRENFTLLLGNPDRAGIIVQLIENGQPLDDRFALVQNGSMSKIQIRCPEYDAILRVFVRGRHEKGMYRWAMDYKIEKSSMSGSGTPFPETFSGFYDHQVRLKEPQSGHLTRGSRVRFDLNIPEARETVIIQSHQWKSLNQNGERFSGTVRVEPGELQIGARFSESEKFDILLKYQVQ